MIARISQKISITLLKSNAINQEEMKVYAYGIELLILTIFDWSITFLLMLLIGKIRLSILYLLVFFLLRRHCGGYHAKTHLRCMCLSNIVYVISVLMAANVFYKGITTWLLVGEIINFIILFKFAPMEHKNKPISTEEIKKHKLIGRIINGLISCIALGLSFMGLKDCAWVMLFGQLSVSLAIMVEKRKTNLR